MRPAGSDVATASTPDLVERAIAETCAATGLPPSVVRPMILMEAARYPESLPLLAAKAKHA